MVPQQYIEEMDGITVKSKQYLEENLPKIGPVVKVVGQNHHQEQVVVFYDEQGNCIVCSGFSWGYWGEGPHGLLWALEKVGFKNVTIDTVAALPARGWQKEVNPVNGIPEDGSDPSHD